MAKKNFKKTIASIFDAFKIIDSKCDGIQITKFVSDECESDDDVEDDIVYLQSV